MTTTAHTESQRRSASRNVPVAATDVPADAPTLRGLGIHLVLGALFGIVLVKSEVVSWFRI